jgi:hypothetical protein
LPADFPVFQVENSALLTRKKRDSVLENTFNSGLGYQRNEGPRDMDIALGIWKGKPRDFN